MTALQAELDVRFEGGHQDDLARLAIHCEIRDILLWRFAVTGDKKHTPAIYSDSQRARSETAANLRLSRTAASGQCTSATCFNARYMH